MYKMSDKPPPTNPTNNRRPTTTTTTTNPLPTTTIIKTPISDIAFGDTLYEAIDQLDWSLALDLIRREAPVDHVVTRPGSKGNSTLLVALERGAPLSIIDPLLRRGADPNYQNYQRRAAFHVAAASKTLTKELIHLLLAFHADVNAICFNGHTPLTLALRHHGVSSPSILLALIQAKADVNYVQTKDHS
jgi:hypothetical protein